MENNYIINYCKRVTTTTEELISILADLNIKEINDIDINDLNKDQICEFLINEYYQSNVIFNENNCSPDRNFDYIYNNMKKLNIPENTPSFTYKYMLKILKNDIKYISNYCSDLPTHMVRYIIGPYKYREYKVNNINIALFGEIHGTLEELPLLDNKVSLIFPFYLESFIKSSKSSKYDLFTEKSFIPKDSLPLNEDSGAYTIQSTINAMFNDCFNKNCQYENSTKNKENKELLYDAIQLIEKFIKTDIKIQKQINLSYFKNQINKFIEDKLRTCIESDDSIALIMDIYCIARMFKKTIPISNWSIPYG